MDTEMSDKNGGNNSSNLNLFSLQMKKQLTVFVILTFIAMAVLVARIIYINHTHGEEY